MNTLPLPKSLKKVSDQGNRAVFDIEPLYPGYGMTVGNTLRRVLLSSLPGAAITNVMIEGVTHEFTTLPYVKEDMVDIVLNLKRIRVKMHGDEPVNLKISVSGAKKVTAKDIETPGDVEIINTDQPIATLTDKAAKLEMTLTVEAGRGYVPVEQREKPKNPIGMIAIDAAYSPLRNVNFTTANVRVGQMTNYDKLTIDITTDGSIDPESALRAAAQIMVDHFKFVLEQDIEKAGADAQPTDEVPAAEITPDTTTPDAEVEDEKPKKRATKKKSTE
jgi:DNA-directed RNA polymerase subunit alpha